jgi:hypothetical protein
VDSITNTSGERHEPMGQISGRHSRFTAGTSSYGRQPGSKNLVPRDLRTVIKLVAAGALTLSLDDQEFPGQILQEVWFRCMRRGMNAALPYSARHFEISAKISQDESTGGSSGSWARRNCPQGSSRRHLRRRSRWPRLSREWR